MGFAGRISMAFVAAASVAGMAQAQATSAADYVKKAGAADQYEIQSSKLVLGSGSPTIHNFANEMIADHTKSTNMVKAAAMKAGMHPAPPMLDADGRQNIAALKAASGTRRDALYVSQQKTAHQKALMLHQNYAADGTSTPLKTAAGNIVPVVQHHISELDQMPATAGM